LVLTVLRGLRDAGLAIRKPLNISVATPSKDQQRRHDKDQIETDDPQNALALINGFQVTINALCAPFFKFALIDHCPSLVIHHLAGLGQIATFTVRPGSIMRASLSSVGALNFARCFDQASHHRRIYYVIPVIA
jgi:hypothetical protein